MPMATDRGGSGTDAVKEVHRLLCQGYTEVVDADLSKYFDTIPHEELLRSVARRIVDRHVLRLIKLWLKTPVEETEAKGRRRMSGGKDSTCGTPQGGVISPLARQPLHEPLPPALAAADGARRSGPMSSTMPTTSSSSAAATRRRRWRGRGR